MAAVRARLTYANVMASVAVFLALGGGAYAAKSTVFGAGGVLKQCISKKGKERAIGTGKHCKKGEQLVAINEKGVQGNTGLTGGAAPQGAQGPKGDKGDTGAAGSAVAYAHVNVDGTVDASKSSNITSANVTKGAGTGHYCFKSLSFTPHVATANIDYGNLTTPGNHDLAEVQIVSSGTTFDCGTNEPVEVATSTGGGFANLPFYIIFN